MEIKLERLGDSENMKIENTYSVNFYQFFELAQQSETIDINEYIFDEFVIKKIVGGKEKKYSLNYNKESNSDQLASYELKQVNIENGLLKDAEFFKEFDNVEFRISTM